MATTLYKVTNAVILTSVCYLSLLSGNFTGKIAPQSGRRSQYLISVCMFGNVQLHTVCCNTILCHVDILWKIN
jgi:hypothetical protein